MDSNQSNNSSPDQEEVTLVRVDSSDLRIDGSSAAINVTSAIEIAGFTGSYTWAPQLADELGILLAEGSDEVRDGRSSKYSRKLLRKGSQQAPSYVLSLPESVISTLGLTIDEIEDASDTDNPYRVDVYASPSGFIGITPPEQFTVMISADDFDPFAKPTRD